MRLLALFLILTLSLSGCAAVQEQPFQTQDLQPSAMLRFDDVPTPAGFKMLADKSFILESAEVRAGVLRYTGRADVESIVRFYRAQMPVYNWALLSVLEYGDRMLNFERENESCVITIRPLGRRVGIAVSLAPKSPITVTGQGKGKKSAK